MHESQNETTGGRPAKHSMQNRLLGSLKDALLAAGREETGEIKPDNSKTSNESPPERATPAEKTPLEVKSATQPTSNENPQAATPPPLKPTAEEAARQARSQVSRVAVPADASPPAKSLEQPPTTRVVRVPRENPTEPDASAEAKSRTTEIFTDDDDEVPRTELVRGRQKFSREEFSQDPVVGFLVVVGGPGLGAYRPVFEGNNTLGRGDDNRIPLNFGDNTISSDAQAYIRYDSSDRSFLFVPNLAKTNIVSVNDKRPTAAVELKPMDVISFGRTQVAFLPFCGDEFDWSEIGEA